jgi:hypothetical protein
MTNQTKQPRPWCVDRGHAPNPAHAADGFCALAWEAGITEEDNPEECSELRRAIIADRRWAEAKVDA